METVPLEPNLAFAQAEWQSCDNAARGERIRAAMKARGMRAAELSRRLGVTSQAVGNWVHGDTYADWARWMAITLALGLPQTWKPGDPVPQQGE